MLASRDSGRLLVFCDEDAEIKDPVAALTAHRTGAGPTPGRRSGRTGGRLRRATNAPPCSPCRTWCGSRSGRASCAPTPPRSRPSRWSAQCSETGGRIDRPIAALRFALIASAVWRRTGPGSMLDRAPAAHSAHEHSSRNDQHDDHYERRHARYVGGRAARLVRAGRLCARRSTDLAAGRAVPRSVG